MPTTYALSCGDLGIECNFETTGADLDDVILHCAEHAAREHGVKTFSRELYLKMRSHLRTIEADVPGH